MKKLSDLDKHLKEFDEISIEPEATDIDKLIEQYDDIILENPKEAQIRERYEGQMIDKEFLNEQYMDMGKFYGKMVDTIESKKPKYETTEQKIVREIDKSKKPQSFIDLEDNYLVKKFGTADDMSNFRYELGTEKTFVLVFSIDNEELISDDFMISREVEDLVNRQIRWHWDNRFSRLAWKFNRKVGDANSVFRIESEKIQKGKTYITFWKIDKDMKKVQIALNNESALSNRIDSDLYTSTKSYGIDIDSNISWNLYDLRIYDIYLNHKEQLMVTDALSKLYGVKVD